MILWPNFLGHNEKLVTTRQVADCAFKFRHNSISQKFWDFMINSFNHNYNNVEKFWQYKSICWRLKIEARNSNWQKVSPSNCLSFINHKRTHRNGSKVQYWFRTITLRWFTRQQHRILNDFIVLRKVGRIPFFLNICDRLPWFLACFLCAPS